VPYNSESPVLFDSLRTVNSCLSDEMGPYTGETVGLELFDYTDMDITFNFMDYFEAMTMDSQ
jgi:hypothetical protein